MWDRKFISRGGMEGRDFFPFTAVHPSSSLVASLCQFLEEIMESTRQTGDEESSNKTLSLGEAKMGIPKAKTVRTVGLEMTASPKIED